MQYAYQYYLALQSQYQAAPFQAIPYAPHPYSTTGTNTTTNTVYMTPAGVMSQGLGAQQQHQQQYMYQAVPGMMPGPVQYQQPYPIVYATPKAMLPSSTPMAPTAVTSTGPARDNTRAAVAPGLLSSVVYPIQPVAVVLPAPASRPTSNLAFVVAEEIKEEEPEGVYSLHTHDNTAGENRPNQHRTATNNKSNNGNDNNNNNTHGTTIGPLAAAPATTTTRVKQHRRHKKHNKVPSVIITPSHSSPGTDHVTTDLTPPNEPNLFSSTTSDSSLPSSSHAPTTTVNAAMPTTEYRTHSSPLPTIPHTSTTTGGAAAHPDSSSSGDINLL